MSEARTPAEELRRERALLFRRFPRIVAHASELARPGDFVTTDAGAVPLLLTRSDAGLKAFVNICRHRATRVESKPSGSDKKCFVCPLHGWVYDLEGKLEGEPEEARSPLVEKGKLDLVPVPVTAAFGLVWVSLTRDGPLEPRAFATGVTEALDALDLGAYEVEKRHATTEASDWRRLVTMLLDCDGSANVEPHGLHASFASKIARRGWIHVFPATMIVVGDKSVRIVDADPLQPKSTRVHYLALVRRGEEPDPFDESTRLRHDPRAEELFDERVARALGEEGESR